MAFAPNKMAPGMAGGLDPTMAAAQSRIQGATHGRAGELANDPRLNQSMDFFAKVMSGGAGPFTAQSKNAMANQQASGSAAAQAAQLRALQEATIAAGGSLQDPSFQAKVQELNANRQGANMDARGRIEAQAAQANFGAQMAGAGQLAGIRGAQNAQINQMRMAGAEHDGRMTSAQPAAGTPGDPRAVQGGIAGPPGAGSMAALATGDRRNMMKSNNGNLRMTF